jgi:hypothetical protein
VLALLRTLTLNMLCKKKHSLDPRRSDGILHEIRRKLGWIRV